VGTWQRPPKGISGAIEGPFITSHDGFNLQSASLLMKAMGLQPD